MAVRNQTEKREVSAKGMGRGRDVGGGTILREDFKGGGAGRVSDKQKAEGNEGVSQATLENPTESRA